MSSGGALSVAARCLSGSMSGCLAPAAGLGSLGLLLLVLLLVAGVTQTLGVSSSTQWPPRPSGLHQPAPAYHYTVHSPQHYGYQLAVFGPGWGAPHLHPAPPPAVTVPATYPPAVQTAASTPPAPLTNDTYSAYLQTSGQYSYASDSGLGAAPAPVPQLQLDYGVPAVDFLAAQASVSAPTEQQIHRRPGANATVVPLIPDNIPLTGEDYPDDGCARDEVRFMRTHRSYSRRKLCQPLLEQGDCPYGHWVVANEHTKLGECVPKLCPDGYAFIVPDGLCHDVREPELCPGKRRVFLTAFGEPSCGCGDGQYLDTAGTCRAIYSSEVCPNNQQTRFNAALRLECADSYCPPEKPVDFHGWCKAFGDPCGDYQFILAFDTTLLEPKCFPADELTGGRPGVERSPQQQRELATTTTTSTTRAPILVPQLHDSYLPPPGQFTQYARRQGLWAGGGRGQGRSRSTLAQWLGLVPRGRPRRRRPPQTPLLDPWSRLDIDQVTFVDSERISSDELHHVRRPQRRRRLRRQIFSRVPLLNSCRPGARNGPNFKCRDKVLPESRSLEARGPIAPSNAPKCPEGQRLDPVGRCRSSVSGLGK